MKLVIDGKEVPVVNDVRVIYGSEDPEIPTVHLVMRNDGLTIDLVKDEGRDENPIVGSSWYEVTDLVELVETST